MTRWLNNSQEGKVEGQLAYIEGWFLNEDKEAFELAIEALQFMNNHSDSILDADESERLIDYLLTQENIASGKCENCEYKTETCQEGLHCPRNLLDDDKWRNPYR